MAAALIVTVRVTVPPFSARFKEEAARVNVGTESLSVVVTLTLLLSRASYFVSAVLLWLIATVIVLVTLSSSMLSSTPVIVTFCALFQFDGVKVRVEAERLVSLSLFVSEKTTFPVGSLLSVTTMASVLPLSATTVEPPDSVTVKAAVSSSVVLTVIL